MTALIRVEDLHVTFRTARHDVPAVRGITFDIHRGECVAIVGESGSGKSVTARTLVGLAGSNSQVRAERLDIDGNDATGYRTRDWRRVRGRFAGLVLQDALVSLDPLRTVGDEIGEVLQTHGVVPCSQRSQRVEQLLADVHVPEPARRARQYPHQLSGGLRQRALIASAIAAEPPLLIADEPTTALDVTVQAQILRLLAERRAAGATLLLISHDLAVVAQLADRVLVMKDGVIVEEGETGQVLREPRHAYTRLLLAAIPSAASRGRRLSTPVSAVAAALPPVTVDPAAVVARVEGVHKRYGDHEVVRDVSFTIARGETLGLVGESGSGKTTVAQLLFGLVEPTAGSVAFGGQRWSGIPERQRRAQRRGMQLISQDPLSSFDPRYPVERIIAEALPDARDRRARVAELLDRVGLDRDVLDRYPRQLSGGQRQRVAIARAIAPRPSLIICDEPVSALDVSVQAQVLDLLAEIRAQDGTALLFISHDLGVVHHLSDRVLVMHEGSVVEQGHVGDVFVHPKHAYTRTLLDALPALGV
ncbi:peptide/nickel transport system ATP-binding protein [Allocatelliglobosispora scoriae]|uniref:Peptide/nickel transport system ATP-binding protein n=1 Tax=Allocatelliglobosispora scoriae TaxID=643052 RepID=A0A841BYA6_9ACTN|nr:ABC transporter ATP-binding protein [Allocatelliglobosispora scoriae]MBB5874137.1 peptide/nickel transport system ATP-binding protein [Allocatelliglobosispora scoriae]